MSIYETAVRKPITTALIYVAIAVLGLFALSRLSIELMPKTETTNVMVVTSYPGASAADIETNISKPLENSLNGIDRLKHITSKSQDNSSVITLEFRAGTAIAEATNDIRDKLDAISDYLPAGAKKPTIFKFSTSSIPVAILSVESEESASGLSKLLEDRVSNRLQRIDGVGTINISGASKRVVQVYCDPTKLEAYHLTLAQISQLIGVENVNIPAGQIDLGSRTNSIRVQGEFTDPMQLGSIIVTSVGGKDIYLRDVAEIKDTVGERQQENFVNGKSGAIVMITKQEGSNSVEIARQIRAALPEIQQKPPLGRQDRLPHRYLELHRQYDRLAPRDHHHHLRDRGARRPLLPRALACDLHHRPHDPDIARRLVHLPPHLGELAERHIALLALHRHRYGRRRCYRGTGERHDAHRARELSQASCRTCYQ